MVSVNHYHIFVCENLKDLEENAQTNFPKMSKLREHTPHHQHVSEIKIVWQLSN